jgi:CheY-like chemotaxis protein/HPt (histidine-containing phosphotransfer) domain-containing protein
MSRSNLYRAVALAAGRARATDMVPAARPAARAQRSGVVLVAEDNEMNREVIARQLRLLAYRADFASDGKQALELWRGKNYAALITDLRMPEMDGYALTAAIRAEESPGDRLSIIALSANASPDEARLCREAGMDDFMTKPLLLDTLRAVLAKWVGAKPGRNPTPEAPADLGVLKALIGDDPVEIARMVETYRTGSRRLRDELSQAAMNSDASKAASAAHRLKSNAYAIGAKGLGDLCAQIEDAKTAAGAVELDDLVRNMEIEACRVDAYLVASAV